MAELAELFIPFGMVLAFAFLSGGIARGNKTFSWHIFLLAFAVGIMILVWIPVIPNYGIIVAGMCLIGILATPGDINE
jgi:hypothetical protein